MLRSCHVGIAEEVTSWLKKNNNKINKAQVFVFEALLRFKQRLHLPVDFGFSS